MRERPLPPAAGPARRVTLAVDVVVLAPRAQALAVLLARAPAESRERWMLPWDVPQPGEELEQAAVRVTRAVLGGAPTHVEQVGTFSDSRRHPGAIDVSVGVVALSTGAAPPLGEAEWHPLAALPPLASRQRVIVERAAVVVRQRVDQSPLAFRLLPPTFTLSDLQSIYEMLLGRRLHKASFRRALQASYLVEPTDEWRSEGRGRPAQLFRFAPRRRRGGRRGVRFDLGAE